MNTYLITGGAGFIGTNLCIELIKNNKVICIDNLSTGKFKNIECLIDNPNFQFIYHDVKEPIDIECDYIIHLAAYASPSYYLHNPIETSKTILLGTINVLENALKYNSVVLLASTSEVYGEPQFNPQHESYYGNVNILGPRSCYDESKRMMETLGNDYKRMKGLIVKIVRIFNTYGPFMREDDGRVISEFLYCVRNGKDITIHGDGTQTRSLCFISDLVNQILFVLSNDESGPINLGNDEEITISELAYKIQALFGSNTKILFDNPLENDPKRRCPDLTKVKKYNINAKVGIDEGLIRTMQYYE